MAMRPLELFKRDPERTGDLLVVLVHGLAEPDTTWVCKETTWKDLLLCDPLLVGVDVGVVKYDTAHVGSRTLSRFGLKRFFGKTVGEGNFTRIETLSRELKREFDQERIAPYRGIVLVGHSMGGLVSIRYILEETEHEGPLKVRGYISLATPFNGSLVAVGQHYLSKVYSHAQIEQLVPNSEFQEETRNLWRDLKRSNRLEHIRFAFCYGTQDTIVRDRGATPYVVENKWREVVPLPGDHSGIIEISSHTDSSYLEVQKLIRSVMKSLDTDPPPHPPTDPSPGPGERSMRLIDHLSPHQTKMEKDWSRFPADAKAQLQEAMQQVFSRLVAMDEEECGQFLKRYRYPFARSHAEETGMRELWELLTLIQVAYPNWKFDPSDIANLFLESGRWSHLIYSADQQPMLEVVLEIANQLKDSPYGAMLFRGNGPIFPHRLILENTRSTARENVCEHCGQPYPFRNILDTFSEVEYTGVFEEVETNSYAALERVQITCGDCIRHSREAAQNADDVKSRIRKVI